MSITKLMKEQCCGCGACASVCPTKCISMEIGQEGFMFPTVNSSACVECGICEKNCVALKQKEIHTGEYKTKAYVGFAQDERIRGAGSSGGIFQLFANQTLDSGGVVYGAGFDEDFSVKHIRVDNCDDLHKILMSKYVQSDLSKVFDKIESDLKSGKKTLFCGTPCQVSAIYKVMEHKKLLENLFLVDFICHGVPSPGVWNSYVNYLSDSLGGAIKSVSFRDKKRGWHDFSFTAVSESGKYTDKSHETNPYMQSFLLDKNIRKSCFNCVCKPDGYYSDITLGDAWKIEKEVPEWADDKGVSFIAVRTNKGEGLLGSVKSKAKLKEASYEQWCKLNPSICTSTAQNKDRSSFFEKAKNLDYYAFWKEESKISLKKRMRYFCKILIKMLRLEKFIRSKI